MTEKQVLEEVIIPINITLEIIKKITRRDVKSVLEIHELINDFELTRMLKCTKKIVDDRLEKLK